MKTKKLIGWLTLFSLLLYSSPSAFADDYDAEEEDVEESFNRGIIVGPETDEAIQARRREKVRNWSIALVAIAVGITTLVLVSQNHNHNKHRHQ